MLEVSRSFGVSLAQRYWNDEWDEARNRAAYGTHASPEGVGANLRLELSAGDERDLQPGVARLKRLVDHRALAEDFAEFARTPSTLENLTLFLSTRHGVATWRRLTIHEDDRLSCVATHDGRLTLRERVYNLTLEVAGAVEPASGLLINRDELGRAVGAVAPRFAEAAPDSRAEWTRRLYLALRAEVPRLRALEVALNPRESLRVFDDE